MMNKVNLADEKIYFEGEWLSAEDLARKIQEKMDSGEMRFARLAAALEELKSALENARTITVKLILTKKEYEKLLKRGKADGKECIYKAIKAFIEKKTAPPPADDLSRAGSTQTSSKQTMIKCANCGVSIKVGIDQENKEIRCPECGARGLLKPLKQTE